MDFQAEKDELDKVEMMNIPVTTKQGFPGLPGSEPEILDQKPGKPGKLDQKPGKLDQNPGKLDQNPGKPDQKPGKLDQKPWKPHQKPETPVKMKLEPKQSLTKSTDHKVS